MPTTHRLTTLVITAAVLVTAAACGGDGSDACSLARDAYAQVQAGATLDDPRLVRTLDQFRSAAISSMQAGETDGAVLSYHADNLGNLVLSWGEGLDVRPALAAELGNVVAECNSM